MCALSLSSYRVHVHTHTDTSVSAPLAYSVFTRSFSPVTTGLPPLVRGRVSVVAMAVWCSLTSHGWISGLYFLFHSPASFTVYFFYSFFFWFFFPCGGGEGERRRKNGSLTISYPGAGLAQRVGKNWRLINYTSCTNLILEGCKTN